MTEVFAAACKALDDAGLSEGVREQIARQIITAAKFGERDRGRLRAAALAGLSSKID